MRFLTTKTKQEKLFRIARFLQNNSGWMINLHHSVPFGNKELKDFQKEIRQLQKDYEKLSNKLFKLHHENKDLIGDKK